MEEYIDEYGVRFSVDKKTLIRCPQDLCGDYAIPEGTITIGDNAFTGCNQLKSVTIPSSVALLGAGAFNRCTELEDVKISSEHIEEITSTCFRYCSKLRKILLPRSVLRIGQYAFSSSGLEFIAIPDRILEIGYGAFYLCKNLQLVQFPPLRINISEFAFHGCNKLNFKSLQIIEENTVRSIHSTETTEYPSKINKDFAQENDIDDAPVIEEDTSDNMPTSSEDEPHRITAEFLLRSRGKKRAKGTITDENLSLF